MSIDEKKFMDHMRNLILTRMEKRGVQKQLAEIVGKSSSSFNNLRRGRPVNAIHLKAIGELFGPQFVLKALNLSMDEIRGPDQESRPNDHETENDILIKKTREILESDTDYAQSLAANIKSFHNAIQTQKDLAELKNDNAEMKRQLEGLSKSIKQIAGQARYRIEEDDPGNVENGNG